MLSINTNLPSLIAQTSLKTSTNKLNTAIERMTTGFKINSAKDNAANYSITTNMTTRLGAYQIAQDNAAMGLDLITTASDSLDLINDKLVRLRALAEHAANGTYGEQSIKAINSEVNALVDELEREYKNTTYNGIKVFGTAGGSYIKEVQRQDTSAMTTLESVDENTTISSGTYSISSTSELEKLAAMTNNGKISGGEFVLADSIDMKGKDWISIGNLAKGSVFSGTFDGNGYVISNLYSSEKEQSGLFGLTSNATIKNVALENVYIKTNRGSALIFYADNSNISNCYASGDIVSTDNDMGTGGLIANITGGTIEDSYFSGNVEGSGSVGGLAGSVGGNVTVSNCFANASVKGSGGFIAGLIGQIMPNAKTNISNCYSTGTVAGKNDVANFIVDNKTNNSTITNCYSTSKVIGSPDNTNPNISTIDIPTTATELNQLIANGILAGGDLKVVASEQITEFQVGINSNDDSRIGLTSSFALPAIFSLRRIGLDSLDYLSKIDNLISTVSAKQTEYGAAQNRLESALDEISTQTENLTSSRSTLQDADIANVSSEYIRQQILQQASATLLATANQSPALALQLI